MVSGQDDGTFTFACELDILGREPKNSVVARCGFVSEGWETEDLAAKRGEQHYEEHASGEAMSELIDFRDEHGVVSVPNVSEDVNEEEEG